MNEINLNSLKIFLEVANSNSFLEASNKLYMSQPAISKSMSKLEETLNVKLFYRANKGISLTPFGEILYNCLKETKDLLETCERTLAAINDIEKSTLVIGVQSHIVRNYLMNKIDHFKHNHPKIKIELIDMSTSQLIDQLEARKLDFVIDSTPIDSVYKNISITPICSLKTCFIKSAKNNSNPKTIKELEIENIILPIARSSLRKNINKIFDEQGCNINTVLEFGTEDLIIDSVRRNLGLGYVVEPAIDYLVDANIIKKVDIDFAFPEMEINIVKIDCNLTKVAQMFIEEEIEYEI